MVRSIGLAGLLLIAPITMGCRTPPNAALTVPITEDYTIPPDDPRYNLPPESGYRNPPAKRQWGATPPGGGGGSMNMNGQ